MLCSSRSFPCQAKINNANTFSSSLPVYSTKSNKCLSFVLSHSLFSTHKHICYFFPIFPPALTRFLHLCFSLCLFVMLSPFCQACIPLNQVSFLPSYPMITMGFLFHCAQKKKRKKNTFPLWAELIGQDWENSLKRPIRIPWICKDKQWAIKMWKACGSGLLIGYSAFQGDLTGTLMAPSVVGLLHYVKDREEVCTHPH